MMDFLLLLSNGVANCVILLITLSAVNPNYDTNYWLGLFLSFISGYGLSILRDIRKNKFSFGNSMIKFFTSLFLSYLAYMAKIDVFPSLRLEWFIVLASLSSLYIIDVIEKVIELGFPKAAQLLLHNLLSYMDKNKTKEDKL